MLTFLEEYERGQPVVVYAPDGSVLGIPCGFVIFPDGVAWVDDGILAVDYPSHHTHHHLFGSVQISHGTIACQGHTFAPAPPCDGEIGKAWNSLRLSSAEWVWVHEQQEAKLRSERVRFER